MPLFFYRLDDQAEALDDVVRVNLRSVDIRGRASLPVMRFAHQDTTYSVADSRLFRIEGSCDDILLLSYDVRFYACNPCTRRWARLPPLHDLGDIVGFYTGGLPLEREYRVLFRSNGWCPSWDHSYGVMSLSSPAHPIRYIGRPADLEAVRMVLSGGISPSFEMPPVMVDDFLHWLPRARQGNSYLLTFNTVDEVFHWIPPPMVQEGDQMVQVNGDQLLEINGKLATTLVDRTSVEVWLLHRSPYIGDAWVWTYRIPLPEAAILDHRGYDGEAICAAVFVVSEERDVLVQCTHAILQCDAMGTVLQTHQLADNRTILSRYMLQESLLLHAFLPFQQSDANGGDPPFFQAP